MRGFTVGILLLTLAAPAGAQDGGSMEWKKKIDFSKYVSVGAGVILQTVYQQSHDSGYVFEPAMLKVGYLHTDIYITSRLMASVSYSVHSNRLSDAFIKYTVNDYLVIQGGRFKGAGSRAGEQTSMYDADFEDFTYTSENMGIAAGAPDFRHYGLDLSGRFKFVKYKFTWHTSGSERTRYYAGSNDGPEKGNNTLKFKSWDLLLSFFPWKNVETGGHLGCVNRPGMGNRINLFRSAHLYYNPYRFRLKFDYGGYAEPVFAGEQPDRMDYTLHDYINVNKNGFSFMGAYAIIPKLEIMGRYERFHSGPQEKTGLDYDGLHLLSVGCTFYPFPEDKRMVKIAAYYQYRGESGMPVGVELRNNMFVIAWQAYLMSK